MKDINKYLSENEAMLSKFSRIEKSLAAYEEPVELLEGYLRDIEETFHVPYVWLSLVNDPEDSGLIMAAQQSPFVSERLNIIERKLFVKLVGSVTTPILANTNLKPFYALQPPKNKYFLKSICIAPMTCRGQIIGSFNHADYCPLRYRPEMDYRLLEGLMIRVSRRLTELVSSAGQSLAK